MNWISLAATLYMYYRFLYTSTYGVVEEDAPGRHHQLNGPPPSQNLELRRRGRNGLIIVYAVTEHQEITAPDCCIIVLHVYLQHQALTLFTYQGLSPITLKGSIIAI